MAQIERRMLAAQLPVKIFPQLDRQLVRSAEQQHAPDIAQQVDHHRDQHQRADPHPHLLRGVMLLRHAVDHNAHHLRWNKLQDGNNDQQGNCAKIAAPLPAEVPAELSK